jgi:hypothetical protein
MRYSRKQRKMFLKTMVKGNGPLKLKNDDGFPFVKNVEPWDAPTCLPKSLIRCKVII